MTSDSTMRRSGVAVWGLGTTICMIIASVSACSVDQAPEGLRRTPPGPGATVRFDMFHKPLPDIPLPSDLAAWPDPSSRTGLRLNASLLAATAIERDARYQFDTMEGWGTFGWISVSFERDGSDPMQAALNLDNVRARHQGDDYDPANDAIYVVNLRTGIPSPIDLGEGSFPATVADKLLYWPNDPRALEQNLLFDTFDETGGATEPLAYRPELDTDFDGVLDRPNLDDPNACPLPSSVVDDASELARDRCIADHLLTWYERETDTVILRPLVPLQEMTEYAVVLTDRLVDSDGRPVRSPFEYIHHPMQTRGMERLRDHLRDPALAAYYGDIGGTGLDHVAFAWTFTTQPVQDDLRRLRDGIYGQGAFSSLADQFPPNLKLARLVGLSTQEEIAGGAEPDAWKTSSRCEAVRGNPSLIHYESIRPLFDEMGGEVLNMSGKELEATLDSFQHVDYVTVGTYRSPFLIQGGPDSTDNKATFRLDYQSGLGELHADTVPVWIMVPKETATHHQPFPVSIYAHGYTLDTTEMLAYAGNMARQGIATVGIDAAGHGAYLGQSEKLLADIVFRGVCLAPFADAMQLSRARDLNRDGYPDSGGDFWTSYVFHTRDVVRQSVLDHMQLVRIFRSFDGKRRGPDYDGDGKAELAGDFDANGVVDIGGPDGAYSAWGESLGGILTGVLGAVDPYVTASAPGSGGGGLVDMGTRMLQGGAVDAVVLRLLGPLVVGVPVSDDLEVETDCATGDISVRWVMPDVNETASLEVACVPRAQLPPTGGTVVVHNRANGEDRCARSDADGRFRVPIPTSLGDPISIELYDAPDIVASYGTCVVRGAYAQKRTIATWQSATIESGATDGDGNVLCSDSDGCVRFQGTTYGVGSELVAPAEGFGYTRQTPSFRRFLALAQHALDPGDPINFARHFSLAPMTDPWGRAVAPHAVLTLNTVGDMNVPLSTGIAFARASGAVPFLAPDAEAKYPAWSAYATPSSLYEALGNKTPNRVLIDNHVIEGISRLERHPAGPACAVNESDEPLCHPSCPPIDPEGTCLDGQTCIDGTCAKVLGDHTCQRSLFDPNHLDEGRAGFDQQHAPSPLRLARVSAREGDGSAEDNWAPRLLGVPYAASDVGAWPADRRVTGLIDAYTKPEGTHTFVAPNPCEAWDHAQYLVNLTARFFATDGRDVYYLSHPATHACLADNSCPFLTE